MRPWWLWLLALACSPRATAPPTTTIGDLLPATTTGVWRGSLESFPLASLIDEPLHARAAPCWSALERAVAASYQIDLRSRHASVIVVEGAGSQAEVVACARRAFGGRPDPLEVTLGDELVAFRIASLGTVYAAWRGRFLVAGDEPSVREALAGPGAGSPWPARIASLEPGPMAIASSDQLFGQLLGVDSTGWDLVLAELGQAPGPLRMRGHVLVHCASASDAQAAAARVAAGEFQFLVPLPQSLIAALRRLHVTVRGRSVELGFDASTWDGVDWTTMTELAGSLRSSMPAP